MMGSNPGSQSSTLCDYCFYDNHRLERKKKRKESHPTSFTGSGREDVEEHLRYTPRWFFFPLFLSFLLSLHSDGFTLCDYGRAVSSLGEAREDDRGCLLKTAPFSCLSLINIQFSVILYKNIIHTL